MEVEIPQSEIEPISGGRDDIVDKLQSSMETIENILVKSVEPIANVYNTLKQEIILEKAEVEIGIGFSAEGNIFIAKGNANANLKVKLVISPKI